MNKSSIGKYLTRLDNEISAYDADILRLETEKAEILIKKNLTQEIRDGIASMLVDSTWNRIEKETSPVDILPK